MKTLNIPFYRFGQAKTVVGRIFYIGEMVKILQCAPRPTNRPSDPGLHKVKIKYNFYLYIILHMK